MDERPIGLMDSGLGGLSVMRVLHKQLPDESLIFVGDQGHFPYGTKSQEELQQLVLKIGRFLVDQGIKMMIIACNTATGAALPLLQRELPVPVIGVIEPGATAAVNHHLKTVGVIGTASTIEKGAYPRTLHQFDANMTVYSHAAQPMVSIVEHGLTGTPTAQQTVDTELAYFDQHPVDGLILGCTELSLANRAEPLGPGCLDALEVLARAALLFCGKPLKKCNSPIVRAVAFLMVECDNEKATVLFPCGCVGVGIDYSK